MLKPRDGKPPLFAVLTWLDDGSVVVSLLALVSVMFVGGVQVVARLLKLLELDFGVRRFCRRAWMGVM